MEEIKFGTGGFRAIIGENFTKENVQKICQAISNIIIKENKTKAICIGYDNRFMSEHYAVWCSEVFTGNGIKVELFDEAVTTPVSMYATKLNRYNYGLMITASHNPYIYNGLKVFIDEGMDAGIEQTNKIENEIKSLKEIKTLSLEDKSNNLINYKNYTNKFIDSIIKLLNIKHINNLKVVFDTKYGSSDKELELFANKIKLKNYKLLNKNRDAFFGFKPPSPSIDNITELTSEVLNTKADIGFALDADGDRLAVVDEKGNYIDNNYILAIIYYFLAKYNNTKGNSVKNIATSNLLNIVTEKFGHKCIEVNVGFKYVSRGLIENNAIIGGESSGGLAIPGHIWGKDSILVIAMLLKVMQEMKKPFSEIYDEVLKFANNYSKIICDTQYSFTEAKKQEILDKLFNKKIIVNLDYEIDKIVYEDYIKIYYKNGNWVLIRFSGTEPLLRLFVETDSNEENLEIIKKWEDTLGLLNY